MHTIHKQVIDLTHCTRFIAPHGILKPLCVKKQHGDYVFWYETDVGMAHYRNGENGTPELKERVPTYFMYIVGTGREIPTSAEGRELVYIDTVIDGALDEMVWHFYLETVN